MMYRYGIDGINGIYIYYTIYTWIIYTIYVNIPNIRMWFHMVLLMCLDQSDKIFQGLVIGVHQKELFMPKHVRWDLLFDFAGVKCHHLPATKLSLTAAKTLARVHGCWCTVLWHGCFLLLDVQECSFFGEATDVLEVVAATRCRVFDSSIRSNSQFLGRWLLSLGAVVSGHGECISEFAHVSSKTHQKNCCILLNV